MARSRFCCCKFINTVTFGSATVAHFRPFDFLVSTSPGFRLVDPDRHIRMVSINNFSTKEPEKPGSLSENINLQVVSGPGSAALEAAKVNTGNGLINQQLLKMLNQLKLLVLFFA